MEPTLDGDRDRGSAMLGVYWALFSIAFLFVCLRLYARVLVRAIGWDDWITVLTVSLMAATCIIGTFMVRYGGCRHVYYLTDDQLLMIDKLLNVIQPFAIMTVAIGRISVAVLILRILKFSTWRKWFLYICIVSTLVFSVLTCGLIFAQCSPPEALWNPALDNAAHCWDPSILLNLTLFISSWNAFMDISLALLPVTIFRTLQMGHRKKVCLCMLMGLGLFAAIAAIIKTSKLPELNVEDFTWVSFELYSWAIVEIFILVVCGCIPTLGPLYSQWLGSKTLQYYRTLTLHAQGPQSDNPAQRVAMGKIGHPSIIRGRKDRSLWLSTGSYEDLSTGDTRVPSPRETSIALSADGDSRQDNEIMREHSIV